MKNIDIAKTYCKDYKYKFESINGNRFLISKICHVSGGKPGIHFKNWEKFKYRIFMLMEILPDNDVIYINPNYLKTFDLSHNIKL